MSSNKMEEIIEYLKNREQLSSPSIEEIAEAIGMSINTTYHMLTVLEERGYITWEPISSGRIRLVRPA